MTARLVEAVRAYLAADQDGEASVEGPYDALVAALAAYDARVPGESELVLRDLANTHLYQNEFLAKAAILTGADAIAECERLQEERDELRQMYEGAFECDKRHLNEAAEVVHDLTIDCDQLRARVGELEEVNAKHVLNRIDIEGQFFDLRTAVGDAVSMVDEMGQRGMRDMITSWLAWRVKAQPLCFEAERTPTHTRPLPTREELADAIRRHVRKGDPGELPWNAAADAVLALIGKGAP